MPLALRFSSGSELISATFSHVYEAAILTPPPRPPALPPQILRAVRSWWTPRQRRAPRRRTTGRARPLKQSRSPGKTFTLTLIGLVPLHTPKVILRRWLVLFWYDVQVMLNALSGPLTLTCWCAWETNVILSQVQWCFISFWSLLFFQGGGVWRLLWRHVFVKQEWVDVLYLFLYYMCIRLNSWFFIKFLIR